MLNIRDLPPVGVWPKDIRRIDRRSPYGNPFRIGDPWLSWVAVAHGYRADKAGQREAAIALYRAWMTERPVVMGPIEGDQGMVEFTSGRVATISEMARGFVAMASTIYPAPALPDRPDLEPLRGCRLACWCHPLPCHGDVIVELLEESA